MFYGNLGNLKVVKKICNNYGKVIDFLENQDLSSLAIGRYDLADGCYVNVVEYATENTDEGEYEAHRVYDDVHIVISGKERVAWQNIEKATPFTAFNEKEDYGLFTVNEEKEVILTSNHFVVFAPTDVHKPGLAVHDSELVKKAIFKILRVQN